MAGHQSLMVDLGAGDGSAVLAAARASPEMLCVGIDTDAVASREASARAARPARRGGLPNAIFLAADARVLPSPFLGRIDELHATLPWGALLRSLLAAEPELTAGIERGLRPGGRLRVIVSVQRKDFAAIGAAAAQGDLAHLAVALERAGLRVTQRRDLTGTDMATVRSSWARRLGIPTRRAARLLEARKPHSAPGPPTHWPLRSARPGDHKRGMPYSFPRGRWG